MFGRRKCRTTAPVNLAESVDQLRDAAGRMTGWRWVGEGQIDPPRLLYDAADEIERLRGFVLENDEVEAVLAWYSSAACDFGALTPGMQGFLHRLYRWYPEHGQW